ncbi:GH21897 [Drosophila grimshawi]|uniref:GH21897 n=2 Tax=Drosophila grimshawi TaxID=7222 RepID=B4J830_DROGR|nr:GH21897 [Drosophila grimshawi]
MILQNVEILDGFLYILMQLIGSALGYGVAYGLYFKKGMSTKFCVTVVRIDPWWKSILLEFYMTGAWVFAMCASWHTSNEKLLESISLRIGLVVVAATLVGTEATGASMNPFRSLWPAVVAQYWDYIWIYLVIPPVTAALLGVCWRFLYLQGKDESKAEE